MSCSINPCSINIIPINNKNSDITKCDEFNQIDKDKEQQQKDIIATMTSIESQASASILSPSLSLAASSSSSVLTSSNSTITMSNNNNEHGGGGGDDDDDDGVDIQQEKNELEITAKQQQQQQRTKIGVRGRKKKKNDKQLESPITTPITTTPTTPNLIINRHDDAITTNDDDQKTTIPRTTTTIDNKIKSNNNKMNEKYYFKLNIPVKNKPALKNVSSQCTPFTTGVAIQQPQQQQQLTNNNNGNDSCLNVTTTSTGNLPFNKLLRHSQDVGTQFPDTEEKGVQVLAEELFEPFNKDIGIQFPDDPVHMKIHNDINTIATTSNTPNTLDNIWHGIQQLSAAVAMVIEKQQTQSAIVMVEGGQVNGTTQFDAAVKDNDNAEHHDGNPEVSSSGIVQLEPIVAKECVIEPVAIQPSTTTVNLDGKLMADDGDNSKINDKPQGIIEYVPDDKLIIKKDTPTIIMDNIQNDMQPPEIIKKLKGKSKARRKAKAKATAGATAATIAAIDVAESSTTEIIPETEAVISHTIVIPDPTNTFDHPEAVQNTSKMLITSTIPLNVNAIEKISSDKTTTITTTETISLSNQNNLELPQRPDKIKLKACTPNEANEPPSIPLQPEIQAEEQALPLTAPVSPELSINMIPIMLPSSLPLPPPPPPPPIIVEQELCIELNITEEQKKMEEYIKKGAIPKRYGHKNNNNHNNTSSAAKSSKVSSWEAEERHSMLDKRYDRMTTEFNGIIKTEMKSTSSSPLPYLAQTSFEPVCPFGQQFGYFKETPKNINEITMRPTYNKSEINIDTDEQLLLSLSATTTAATTTGGGDYYDASIEMSKTKQEPSVTLPTQTAINQMMLMNVSEKQSFELTSMFVEDPPLSPPITDPPLPPSPPPPPPTPERCPLITGDKSATAAMVNVGGNYNTIRVDEPQILVNINNNNDNVNNLLEQQQSIFTRGAFILAEEPFVYILKSTFRETRCDHCLTKYENLMRCSSCRYVHYCNGTCQKEAWDCIHRYECKHMRNLNGTLSDVTRLLIRLICKKKMKKFDERMHYGDCQYREFSNLEMKLDDIQGDRERTKTFNNSVKVLKDMILPKLMPTTNELQMMYGRLVNSGFNIQDEDLITIGIGIYLIASIFSHSCKPNVAITYTGRKLTARYTDDKQLNILSTTDGVQLLDLTMFSHARIDLMNSTLERHQLLLENYYFHCTCARCLDRNEDLSFNGIYCPNYNCNEKIYDTGRYDRCATCNAPITRKLWDKYYQIIQYTKNQLAYFADHPVNLEACEKLRQKQHHILHTDNIWHIKTLNMLFEFSIRVKRYQDAITYGYELLDGYKKCYGSFSAALGMLYIKVAKMQMVKNESANAFRNLKNANNILRVTHGEHHQLFQKCLNPYLRDAQLRASLEAVKRQFIAESVYNAYDNDDDLNHDREQGEEMMIVEMTATTTIELTDNIENIDTINPIKDTTVLTNTITTTTTTTNDSATTAINNTDTNINNHSLHVQPTTSAAVVEEIEVAAETNTTVIITDEETIVDGKQHSAAIVQPAESSPNEEEVNVIVVVSQSLPTVTDCTASESMRTTQQTLSSSLETQSHNVNNSPIENCFPVEEMMVVLSSSSHSSHTTEPNTSEIINQQPPFETVSVQPENTFQPIHSTIEKPSAKTNSVAQKQPNIIQLYQTLNVLTVLKVVAIACISKLLSVNNNVIGKNYYIKRLNRVTAADNATVCKTAEEQNHNIENNSSETSLTIPVAQLDMDNIPLPTGDQQQLPDSPQSPEPEEVLGSPIRISYHNVPDELNQPNESNLDFNNNNNNSIIVIDAAASAAAHDTNAEQQLNDGAVAATDDCDTNANENNLMYPLYYEKNVDWNVMIAMDNEHSETQKEIPESNPNEPALQQNQLVNGDDTDDHQVVPVDQVVQIDQVVEPHQLPQIDQVVQEDPVVQVDQLVQVDSVNQVVHVNPIDQLDEIVVPVDVQMEHVITDEGEKQDNLNNEQLIAIVETFNNVDDCNTLNNTVNNKSPLKREINNGNTNQQPADSTTGSDIVKLRAVLRKKLIDIEDDEKTLPISSSSSIDIEMNNDDSQEPSPTPALPETTAEESLPSNVVTEQLRAELYEAEAIKILSELKYSFVEYSKNEIPNNNSIVIQSQSSTDSAIVGDGDSPITDSPMANSITNNNNNNTDNDSAITLLNMIQNVYKNSSDTEMEVIRILTDFNHLFVDWNAMKRSLEAAAAASAANNNNNRNIPQTELSESIIEIDISSELPQVVSSSAVDLVVLSSSTVDPVISSSSSSSAVDPIEISNEQNEKENKPLYITKYMVGVATQTEDVDGCEWILIYSDEDDDDDAGDDGGDGNQNNIVAEEQSNVNIHSINDDNTNQPPLASTSAANETIHFQSNTNHVQILIDNKKICDSSNNNDVGDGNVVNDDNDGGGGGKNQKNGKKGKKGKKGKSRTAKQSQAQAAQKIRQKQSGLNNGQQKK